MGQGKKNPSEEPKDEKPVVPPTDPAGAEILSELDNYQHRIESDWESAKSNYQSKINQILDNFIQEKIKGSDKDLDVIFPTESEKKPKKSRMDNIMEKAEKAIRSAERKAHQLTYRSTEKPSVVDIDWPSTWETRRKKKPYLIGALIFMAALCAGIYQYRQVEFMTPLPYFHTGAVITDGKTITISDWFRKSLYIHKATRGLPLLRVETMPNDFLTGLALAKNDLWTLNGFKGELIQHDTSIEHAAVKTFATASRHPVGLFFDGADLWIMDDASKTLTRFQETDPTEIKEEYTWPEASPTSFVIERGKVWMLVKKSREIQLFRLEDPLKKLASYDLDPYLNGSTPTAITLNDNVLWVTTENPSQLVRIPTRKLKAIPPSPHS